MQSPVVSPTVESRYLKDSFPCESFGCFEDLPQDLVRRPSSFSSICSKSIGGERFRPISKCMLTSFHSKQFEYMPNPYYLSTMQVNITAQMRSILHDWMMEVCSELTLKRETLHLSINYIDRFLSRSSGLAKEEYQLLGLTSMMIASKVEEVLPPKLEDWMNSADNGYPLASILDMEKRILKTVEFKILPVTVYNITNLLMTEWDAFISFHFGCVNSFDGSKREKAAFEKRMIFFKHSNQKAYQRFRATMQVLDISVLHAQSITFLPRHLACALLLLMVSKFFYDTNYALLYFDSQGDYAKYVKNCDSLEELEEFHMNHTEVVQELFSEFIRECAGVANIQEIYPAVVFLHPFLDFEAVFELPVACKVYGRDRVESHYEEFLAYQTHDPKYLDFINKFNIV